MVGKSAIQNPRSQSEISGACWNLKSSVKTNFGRTNGTIFVYSSLKTKDKFFFNEYTHLLIPTISWQDKRLFLSYILLRRKKNLLYIKHHLPVNRMINLILCQIISEYVRIKDLILPNLWGTPLLSFSNTSAENFLGPAKKCLYFCPNSSNPWNTLTSYSICG